MKKNLIITAFGVITLLSCSKEENNSTTGGVTNTVQTTNHIKTGYDYTNDGIENFIYRDAVNSGVGYTYKFEYKVAEKTVTVSYLADNVFSVIQTYTVKSDKNGSLECYSDQNDCVFRFLDRQVLQIIKRTGGEDIVKYYFE